MKRYWWEAPEKYDILVDGNLVPLNGAKNMGDGSILVTYRIPGNVRDNFATVSRENNTCIKTRINWPEKLEADLAMLIDGDYVKVFGIHVHPKYIGVRVPIVKGKLYIHAAYLDLDCAACGLFKYNGKSSTGDAYIVPVSWSDADVEMLK